MTAGPARYQAQALHSESHGVKTYLGVDPVTGLPVLIYRFGGSPRAGIERLDSPFLLRILAFRHDASGGLIVAAFSGAYQRATDAGSKRLTAGQLLDSARALEAAAEARVAHGSINADRFLLADHSLLIEGFGVPWQTTGTAALTDDIFDWARTVSSLGYPASEQVDTVVQQALAADAIARPDAAQLVRQLTAALRQPDSRLRGRQGSFSSLEAIEIDFAPSPQFSTERLLQQRQETTAPPVIQPQVAAAAGSPGPTGILAAEAVPAISLPSAQRSATASRPSFVKDLPPGSTYRTGDAPVKPAAQPTRAAGYYEDDPEPPAGTRWRSVMIAALVILTIVLVGLALYSRDMLRIPWNQAPAVTAPLVTYIVDVQVEPADLPPVTLYVLESPPGSALRAGTIVGTAPRKIALDRPGTWVFEGRFQGQTSGPVSIQVPEERNRVVLISIPPASQD